MQLLAFSVDALEEAQKTQERQSITFPLAYGVNGPNFAAQTGAFYDADKGFLHAAGFLLQPDSRLAGAVYSTGAIGRYTPAEVLGMVDYTLKKAH
ncbi:MAG: hypothetical protein NVSMB6_26730 [Burkholderiaceae bacterium]